MCINVKFQFRSQKPKLMLDYFLVGGQNNYIEKKNSFWGTIFGGATDGTVTDTIREIQRRVRPGVPGGGFWSETFLNSGCIT